MLCHNPSCINWRFWLLGLIFVIIECDARAVNVSNTWTMPQEGLNVFYRFFRDRISWFEADAVCQFHHANLVTVDNSFQFDATRDLLRELDVNDIVWIGLMRPQSSDRFMWSNSRPLVADTGYWAESLPLMDAPLCAVIDPIRDYRWHALRCGGPETASFLCEMPVPSWADACNLKDMPNLTLQYMADTASIELIRNCQEEGLLRTMCRGKQDRERAVQDLICPRERLEAQRINDITNSHFKSLQIINSIPSDNNENNDIELLPLDVNYGPHYPEELQTEKNTVQRLIEQFNVDELMQADEPSNMETVSSFYKIPGLIPKPVKKSAKKALDTNKKDNGKTKIISSTAESTQKYSKRLPLEMDEMMMGDQPLQGEPEMPEQFLNEEVSNEILEHLPHIKKTNLHKEDGLEKLEKEAMAMKKSMQKSKEMENKKLFMATSPAATPAGTTTELPLTTLTAVSTIEAEEVSKHNHDHNLRAHFGTHLEVDSTKEHLTTTTASVTIGHPMHPLQPHSNVLNEESIHSLTKESADSSHFIPPMLMVKSHYIPPASKHSHNEHDHHQHHQQPLLKHEQPATHLETTTEEKPETTQSHQQNQTLETTMMAATTPNLLDLQKTTLKNLDTSLSSAENEKRIPLNVQKLYPVELMTTTEKDTSIKPNSKETEQPKNAKSLNFKETQTTATTSQPDAATTARAAENIEITSFLADKSKEINKNKNIPEKYNDETQELKIPQTSHAADETTPATKQITTTEKSLKSTQKLYDLETATDIIETRTETAGAITTQNAQQQQNHVPAMEEKPKVIKNQENKEHLQITAGTTEKHTSTQTAQVTTSPATTATETVVVTQQTPATTNAALKGLQQIEKDQPNKEELKEEEEKEQDKMETIVKTTEIQQTSTAIIKVQETSQDEAEDISVTTTSAQTPTHSTSLTPTTTVKPITATSPPNVEKSTSTSFSAATRTTANMPTTSNEDKTSISISVSTTTTTTTSTSTITPPTSTTSPTTPVYPSTTTASSTTTENGVTTGRAETSTQPSSVAPETTRNFLKVTTEMPFKPNRRRSLTKPETVSYMKKILG